MRASVVRIHAASEQHASAIEESEASARVARSARARLGLLRETNLDELAVEAEQLVAEYVEAVERLTEPLTDLVERWQAAQIRWESLRPAIQARIMQADRERG
jgi:hypothetical protein